MEIIVTPHEKCNLVSVSGRIDSLTASPFSEALKKLFQNEKYVVVIDLEHVNYVSSAGLRVLIDAQKICKPQGGQVTLLHVPPRIYETLELAGLTSIFLIKDDPATCL